MLATSINSIFTTCSTMPSGLGVKAFMLHDPQSDAESFARMNSRFLSGQPLSPGLHVMMFVGAMASSCWEGSRGLSLETQAKNALSGYFLLLANCACLEKKCLCLIWLMSDSRQTLPSWPHKGSHSKLPEEKPWSCSNLSLTKFWV